MKAQQYICDLTPYQLGVSTDAVVQRYGVDPKRIVRLASNENPLGMGPKARAALRKTLPTAHRYPEQYNLVQALARKFGVDPDGVILGNGSNDVLDLLARTYLNDGDEAVSSQYAFSVYDIATRSAGATSVVVPAKAYGHDLAAMAAAITPQTKLVWLANPNNPIGTFIPHARIKQFIANAPKDVVIVLDEAYHEYLPPADQVDTTKWLREYPNLVLVRTFSKMHGLAGLRIGYGLTSPQIAGLLNRVRHPFNAGTLALAAAVAALDDDEFVQRSYLANTAGRTKLIAGLKALGLECLPSHGNFVTFRTPNAQAVNESLLAHGVLIRPLAGAGLPDFLRATVGLPKENKRFLAVLKAVLQ